MVYEYKLQTSSSMKPLRKQIKQSIVDGKDNSAWTSITQ